MQLTLENPEFRFLLRGADGASARVNERELRRSFIITPDRLLEDWRPRSIDELGLADLEPLLALEPGVVLLGSGARLHFPGQPLLAAFLTRGIGIEVMDNGAAARTYNLLAGEGRTVVAAFLL
ncbi:MAG: Mth938-like domain-containing protein [Arenimonas sp.]